MRRRNGFTAVALLLTIVSLITLRYHVRELFQVARTYATFSSYIKQHQELLLKLPVNNTIVTSRSEELAPRILHQIYLSADDTSVPARYTTARQSCIDLHTKWTHELWTSKRANTFMRDNYPEIYPHYASYEQNIQRANILRYALLHKYGGVYLDLDVKCLQSLDALLPLPLLTPGAYPAGINNAFILARPGHGFFSNILSAVPSRDLRWAMPYIENMLSTGCMFFSNRWMNYVRSLGDNPKQILEADKVYVLSDETGNMDPHMLRGVITTPLFHHDGASSWHRWDAAVIVLIGKYYGRFLFGLTLLFLTPLVLSIILTRRSRRGSLDNWSPKVRTSQTSEENLEKGAAIGEGLVKQS